MTDILSFPPPANDGDGPHLEGVCKCLACGHEWQAAAPVGTTDLECPECACFRGVWKNPIVHSTRQECFMHHCGSDCFSLVRIEGDESDYGSLLCLGCGELVTW